MGLIRDALCASRTQSSSKHRAKIYPGTPPLYVSELGYCPRKTILRVAGVEGEPFPARVQEAMSLGVAYEDDTLKCLMHSNIWRIETQTSLRSEPWSGKIDFLVHRDNATPLIVEHKATGDKWWDYGYNLPKLQYVYQAAAYGVLYEQLFGVVPEVVLYYRSWSNWAEFVITRIPATEDYDMVCANPPATFLRVEGEVSGVRRAKTYHTDICEEMRTMAAHWHAWRADHNCFPSIPLCGPNDSDGCTFRGEPNCPMWRHCWGDSCTFTGVTLAHGTDADA